MYRKEQKYIINGLLLIADEVLDERTTVRKSEVADNDPEEEELVKKPEILIDALMNPKNKLSIDEIKQEINTFIAAGHDTSAVTMSTALLMLAMHPEYQEKVYQELKEAFGSAHDDITYTDLNNLVFLDWVVKETMRLFPILPFSGRQATEEFQIGEISMEIPGVVHFNWKNFNR